ncbi:hypothetical protein WN55_03808 [Dufourea novaeangliae]|uniref:Uncharacterized protein n=1 Tax=Dufourea novaeangliae TaxID=178035 RepID=A0A154PLF2_DUFNO|nr:hypothetical protein WN55_03808 [Dufourea novaeangliae]
MAGKGLAGLRDCFEAPSGGGGGGGDATGDGRGKEERKPRVEGGGWRRGRLLVGECAATQVHVKVCNVGKGEWREQGRRGRRTAAWHPPLGEPRKSLQVLSHVMGKPVDPVKSGRGSDLRTYIRIYIYAPLHGRHHPPLLARFFSGQVLALPGPRVDGKDGQRWPTRRDGRRKRPKGSELAGEDQRGGGCLIMAVGDEGGRMRLVELRHACGIERSSSSWRPRISFQLGGSLENVNFLLTQLYYVVP